MLPQLAGVVHDNDDDDIGPDDDNIGTDPPDPTPIEKEVEQEDPEKSRMNKPSPPTMKLLMNKPPSTQVNQQVTKPLKILPTGVYDDPTVLLSASTTTSPPFRENVTILQQQLP